MPTKAQPIGLSTARTITAAFAAITNETKQRMKKYKIKNGVNPVGTRHNLIAYHVNNGAQEQKQFTYVVRNVTGLEGNLPSGEPVVYLAYAGGKSAWYPQVYISMPLSMFAQESSAVSEADVFWEEIKGSDVELDEDAL